MIVKNGFESAHHGVCENLWQIRCRKERGRGQRPRLQLFVFIRVHSCQFVVRPGRMVLFALVVSVLASVQGAELLNADFEVLKSHADRDLELHGNGQSYDSICTSVA